jgi:uridine kinase
MREADTRVMRQGYKKHVEANEANIVALLFQYQQLKKRHEKTIQPKKRLAKPSLAVLAE